MPSGWLAEAASEIYWNYTSLDGVRFRRGYKRHNSVIDGEGGSDETRGVDRWRGEEHIDSRVGGCHVAVVVVATRFLLPWITYDLVWVLLLFLSFLSVRGVQKQFFFFGNHRKLFGLVSFPCGTGTT